MTVTAHFVIDHALLDTARSAVQWLPGFNPAVASSLEGDVVVLRSERHDELALAAIWSAALANERLFEAAKSHRQDAQQKLAR